MPSDVIYRKLSSYADTGLTHVTGLKNGLNATVTIADARHSLVEGGVFANGAALLAAVPQYAGQIMVALDGAVAIPRTAATGHTADPVVFLASIAYFTGVIKPNRIDSISTSPQTDFVGAAHRLSATGDGQDNTLLLENHTGLFAAVTLGKGRGYPEATFGTNGGVVATEYNGCYIATSSPDGTITPIPIGLYQEEPVGGRTHRRIFCDYAAKTVTIYGLNLSGTVTPPDILVTDPIGLQVQGNGAVKISTLPPASASAAGVAGTITWDSGFIYICTATNTWKRVAIATW